jgi:hypothetical protein
LKVTRTERDQEDKKRAGIEVNKHNVYIIWPWRGGPPEKINATHITAVWRSDQEYSSIIMQCYCPIKKVLKVPFCRQKCKN